MKNRSGRLGPHAALGLLTFLTACGHPAATTGPAAGQGGGGGATPVTTGAGGVSGSQGSGGSSSVTGAGGTGNVGPGTGSGGSVTTGSGGSPGGVVITPDAGMTGMVTKTACVDDPMQRQALPYTPGYTISAAAQQQSTQTVQSMSLVQKENQLRGTPRGNFSDIFRSAPRAAADPVREFLFRDGPRGVNLDAERPTGSLGSSTVFPVASARGAAFDVDLEYQVGLAMGDELIASGHTILLAPTVNILRHPAWGRSQETYGEDSFLLGRLGTAFTVGVQQYGPACAKHYAANNVERNRVSAVAQMDEQTLQEVYARHFGMIIQDGGVACIMAAYNFLQITPGGQAIHCTQDHHLLTDILRGEFDFQGFVLSDWWAMPGGSGLTDTNLMRTQGIEAIRAGLDLEMPWSLNYSQLDSAVSSNLITEGTEITQAVQRVVSQKYRFNVASANGPIGLKAPTTSLSNGSIVNNDAHIVLAEKAAEESIVLLKNENNTLPIKNDGTIRTVAVVGLSVVYNLQGISLTNQTINFATDAVIGDRGSSRVNMDPAKAIGPYAGIVANAPTGITVLPGHDLAAASSADFVVVVAGLTPEDEGEEYTIQPENTDRDGNLGLDGKKAGAAQTAQTNFILSVANLRKPMVVVLEGGSAIELPTQFFGSVPAIVMAWYPGQSGGTALGKLLFGQSNFSGKLPISWPVSLADEPTFSTGATAVMSYYLGYRWFDNQNRAPLYPFGHGLSYTNFEYSNLQVPCSTVTKGGVVKVTVDIKNTGTVAGDEVAFLFTSYPGSRVATRQPTTYKELKGFQRVSLMPGEAKRVTIPIRVSDISYYDTTARSWQVETGSVKVMVGPSANTASLTLSDTFTVQ